MSLRPSQSRRWPGLFATPWLPNEFHFRTASALRSSRSNLASLIGTLSRQKWTWSWTTSLAPRVRKAPYNQPYRTELARSPEPLRRSSIGLVRSAANRSTKCRASLKGGCSRAPRAAGGQRAQESCVFICEECVTFSAQIIAGNGWGRQGNPQVLAAPDVRVRDGRAGDSA